MSISFPLAPKPCFPHAGRKRYHILMLSRASVRFLLASVFLCGFLAGCSSSKKVDITCTKQYWNGTIGMCLPDGWNVMEKERLDQLGVPSDTVLVLQTDQPVSGTYPNVAVTTETLARPVGTPEYSKGSVRAVSALPGYQLIDERTAKVDGMESEIHVYSAQPSADQPRVRFYQESAVSNGVGYTVTAFAPLSVSQALEQQILLMLQSFTFVKSSK